MHGDTYLIRTVLDGGRCVDLPGGWDDNGNDAQRWHLVPMGDVFYKIAPKNNVWKTLDLWGVSSNGGTPVKLYDFWDGLGQQVEA